MAWDDLTVDQQLAARELARRYRQEKSATTLPSYVWIKRAFPEAEKMPQNTFIAFGRAVLDACKALQTRRGTSS